MIEQNIGVATAVSDHVAIMVNGRINRVMEARRARRRPRAAAAPARRRPAGRRRAAAAGARSRRERRSADGRSLSRRARRGSGAAARAACEAFRPADPLLPERWNDAGRPSLRQSIVEASQPEDRQPRGSSPSRSPSASAAPPSSPAPSTPRAASSFIRDRLKALGIPTRTVDLSTSGKPSTRRRDAAAGGEHASARHIGGVFTGDRGRSVTAMAEAFARWIAREPRIGGVISAGGSGGTTLATAGMRALPVGIPKVMVSTVAAGDVARLCRRRPTS